MQRAKHDSIRNTNTLIVLESIINSGPVTKREIQEKTCLSWGAVSNITNELLRKKIIVETKSSDSSVGRTPSQLDVNSSENLIIGLDINIEGITAVLIDLKCRVLKKISQEVLKTGAEDILKQVKLLVHLLLQDSHAEISGIIGLGVAMQGAVDTEKGISIFSPHFPNWENVPLKDILEKEFDIPVFVEHDPNCMALSERWMGAAKGVNNLLFIRLSMGIGMSIIINGELYKGADGSAGEFGHITMNPGGPRCSCGNYGCLEVYVSGSSIIQKAAEGLILGRFEILPGYTEAKKELGLKHIVAAARQGDGFAENLFQEAGIYLGIGISNLVNIMNPDLIVIGGEMAKCSDLFLDVTMETILQKAWKNSRVNVVTSKLENDSAAIGAAALFVQKLFNREKVLSI